LLLCDLSHSYSQSNLLCLMSTDTGDPMNLETLSRQRFYVRAKLYNPSDLMLTFEDGSSVRDYAVNPCNPTVYARLGKQINSVIEVTYK